MKADPLPGMHRFSNGWSIDVHAVAVGMVYFERIDPTGMADLEFMTVELWHKAVAEAADSGITMTEKPYE